MLGLQLGLDAGLGLGLSRARVGLGPLLARVRVRGRHDLDLASIVRRARRAVVRTRVIEARHEVARLALGFRTAESRGGGTDAGK